MTARGGEYGIRRERLSAGPAACQIWPEVKTGSTHGEFATIFPGEMLHYVHQVDSPPGLRSGVKVVRPRFKFLGE